MVQKLEFRCTAKGRKQGSICNHVLFPVTENWNECLLAPELPEEISEI